VRIAGFVATLVLGFGIWYYFLAGGGGLNRLTPVEGQADVNWYWTLVLGFVVMLIGIVLGVACRRLIEQKSKGDDTIQIRAFFRRVFTEIDLWISLLGSPLIYGGSLKTGAELSSGAFFYFALQSGFSSYVTINALLAGKGGGPGEPQK
jgi:hypothetical protein